MLFLSNSKVIFLLLYHTGNKVPAVCDVSVLFKCNMNALSEMQGNDLFSVCASQQSLARKLFCVFLKSSKSSLLINVLQLIEIKLSIFLIKHLKLKKKKGKKHFKKEKKKKRNRMPQQNLYKSILKGDKNVPLLSFISTAR